MFVVILLIRRNSLTICIKCGFCCKEILCKHGKLNEETKQCINLIYEQKQYFCKIFDEKKHNNDCTLPYNMIRMIKESEKVRKDRSNICQHM